MVAGGLAYVQGMHGPAFAFDGVDDWVAVPHHLSLDFGTLDLSVSFWIRTTDADGTKVVLDKRAAADHGFHVFLSSGRPGIQLRDGVASAGFVSPVGVADGTYHHVAIVVDRDQVDGGTIFVDGVAERVFDPTTVPGSLDNEEELRLGRRNDPFGGDGYLQAELDEVLLYASALSEGSVLELYDGWQGLFADGFEAGDTTPWSSTSP